MADRTPTQIGQDMIDQLTGCETQVTFEILAAVLGTSIGGIVHMSGGSQEIAMGLIDEIAENARSHIRENWGQIETVPLDG